MTQFGKLKCLKSYGMGGGEQMAFPPVFMEQTKDLLHSLTHQLINRMSSDRCQCHAGGHSWNRAQSRQM